MEEATMTRRTRALLIPLALAILVVLLTTNAQAPAKVPGIGWLASGLPPSEADRQRSPFFQGLRALGWVEGQNITIEARYAEERNDRLPALAAELVQLKVAVIVAGDSAAIPAAKQATSTIPIVLGVANDLVEEDLVVSLERPGGNLTGVELRDIELLGKRLELFKEAVPTLSRVAVLVDPSERSHAHVPRNIEAEARALSVQVQRVEVGDPEAFEAAFAAMVQGGTGALIIMDTAFFVKHRPRLLELAARYRLPTISGTRGFAEAGSRLAYGARVPELCQRSAVFVDKLLKGATPADLPVERADKFYLVVNLTTAEALGLTLSPTFLYRADEVIK
jgi:putative ABC transport system substrate-binding protein